MRRLITLVAIVAGCGGGGPLLSPPGATAAASDPLAQPERALAVETLPGVLAGPWPVPVARLADGWLIPWHDSDGVHARFIGDDGARSDRFVDGGALVGVAALDDGYAIAAAVGSELRAHFIVGEREDVVVVPLDGNAVLAAASDGSQLLVAATHGGDIAIEDPRPIDATLLLVSRAGARVVELGRVAAAPTLWGDAAGFVVGGALLCDGHGVVGPAPGHQVRDARIFRRPVAAGDAPTSDTISFDGAGWMAVDGLVGWAGRDASTAQLEVVHADGSRALVEVGDDLTPRATRTLPPTVRGDGGQAWMAAASSGRVVWASTIDNDPVFAILDASGAAAGMRADGGIIRLRNASSRATVTNAASAGMLLAWTEGRSTVHYAVQIW